MRVVLAHIRDIAVDHIRRRVHLMFSGDQHLCHVGLSITAPNTLTLPHTGTSGWIAVPLAV